MMRMGWWIKAQMTVKSRVIQIVIKGLIKMKMVSEEKKENKNGIILSSLSPWTG